MTKDIDITVYGATGFTGCRIVQQLTAWLGREQWSALSVGVAGRRESALQEVASQAVSALGSSRVHVIVADVQDSHALQSMAARSRVIINAAGPFRLLGLPVVAAAVHGKAHYVDVSGEPLFQELAEARYHDAAVEAGVRIIPGCGFDSIPADIGSLLTSRAVAREGAQPSSVQAFLTVESGPQGFAGHYGTWASLVGGLGAADDLRALPRQQAAQAGRTKPRRIGAAPKRGRLPFQPTELPGKYGRMWALPFPGADAAMQRRTARLFASPRYQGDDIPVHFQVYFLVPSLLWAAVFVIWGLLLGLLTKSAWGRSVLLKHPKLFSMGKFSHAGPTQAQMDATQMRVMFHGSGYSSGTAPTAEQQAPDVHLLTQFTGPEPGYVATPVFACAAALTLLDDGVWHAGALTGVLTPAAAFHPVGATAKLMDLIQQGSVHFERI